jgi:predicted lipoprotein with Yx(FWY)xxD motif
MVSHVISRSVAILAFLAASVLASTGAHAAVPRQTAATTVMEANNALGTILTSGSGLTLYVLTSEVGGTIKCSGGCLSVWPPLTVSSGTTPTGPSDLPGKLGTVTRADGTVQVTYEGFPLYMFVRDSAPGDTHGNGINAFGGVWLAARPNAVPLSATLVVTGAVRIAAPAGRARGTVSMWYRLGGARQSSTCAAPSCALTAPLGYAVHLHQRPAPGARFAGWSVTRNGQAVLRSRAPALTIRMASGVTIAARYSR